MITDAQALELTRLMSIQIYDVSVNTEHLLSLKIQGYYYTYTQPSKFNPSVLHDNDHLLKLLLH